MRIIGNNCRLIKPTGLLFASDASYVSKSNTAGRFSGLTRLASFELFELLVDCFHVWSHAGLMGPTGFVELLIFLR